MEKRFLAILQSLEHELSMMEKQIGKLAEIIDSSPVLHQKELLREEDRTDATFVIVHQQHTHELVEQLKFQAACMRYAVEACLAPPGTAALDRWIAQFGEGELE